MSGIPAGAGALLGKRLGKYEILALLALGGTAEIYLARIDGTAGFEKYVVVKCLHDHLVDDPDFVKMFLDEARLAALLDHSNIVQTFELGEHENRYYMVMEFLAGLSLAMVVRRAAERLPGGRLPVQLALNGCAQACAGLHYAHERTSGGRALNIVHRDMSPQNLVVSFEGVVKVVDFGIAKAEMRETRTRSGTIKGKFAYMSPEQCIANNVDRRTDVFALGVILHELLTGRRLFKRPSPYDTYQAVIECNVAPPSQLNHELDPALDPIVLRALAKDKEKRYETAEAFGDALLGYLHHRGKGSGPGELSRFFDTHFTQELEEHSSRMRDFIAGRELRVDTGVDWDEEMEAAAAAARAADSAAARAADKADRADRAIDSREAAQARRERGQDGAPPIVASGEISLSAQLASASIGSAPSRNTGPVVGELSQIISNLDDAPGEHTRIDEGPLDNAQTIRPGALDISDLGDWVGEASGTEAALAPGPDFAKEGGAVQRARPPSAPTLLAPALLDPSNAGEQATQISPAISPARPALGGPPAVDRGPGEGGRPPMAGGGPG
ncbi:MAG TPA: protein kinase, partial [Kofleriaceae bacterium]|nr:protein kinase [Kofleriaceae bacterium]